MTWKRRDPLAGASVVNRNLAVDHVAVDNYHSVSVGAEGRTRIIGQGQGNGQQLLDSFGVPDFDGTLFQTMGGDDAPAIRTESDAGNGAGVAAEDRDFLLARHVPHADNAGLTEVFVGAGPYQARAVQTKRQAANLAAGFQGE